MRQFNLPIKVNVPFYGVVDASVKVDQFFHYMSHSQIIQISLERTEEDGYVQVRRTAFHPDRPFGNDPQSWGHVNLKANTVLNYWKQRVPNSLLPQALRRTEE